MKSALQSMSYRLPEVSKQRIHVGYWMALHPEKAWCSMPLSLAYPIHCFHLAIHLYLMENSLKQTRKVFPEFCGHN